MKQDWRLISEVTIFIDKNNELWLAAPDKKTYISFIEKKLKGTAYEVIQSEQNEFSVKLSCSLGIHQVFVKSEILPNSDWYRVANYVSHPQNFISISTQTDMCKGEVQNSTFEACFSDSFPGEVGFICPEMEEYSEAFTEFRRRMNCLLFKKTRKWKIGHRYDSLDNTFYYLQEVVCRKNGEDSLFITDPLKMVTGYLVCDHIPEGCTTVSSVLEKLSFDNGLKIVTTMSSMVDSGEVIEDDMSGEDIQDYWKYMIQNSTTLYNLLYIFTAQSIGHLAYDKTKYMSEISEVLIEKSKKILYGAWNIPDIYSKGSDVLSSNPIDTNAKSIFSRLIWAIQDPNPSRAAYYSVLLKEIGIDITDLIKTILSSWNPDNDVYGSFENFYNAIEYVKVHDKIKYIVQREKSTNYPLEKTTIGSLYKDTTILQKVLLELITDARESNGLGVENWRIAKVKVSSGIESYQEFIVTIDNVLNYVSEKMDLSRLEILKNEIVQARFHSIKVTIDLEKQIE